jgi:streptogramin lyase/photosystem II stability/assembly factor-like uncharacterized protein
MRREEIMRCLTEDEGVKDGDRTSSLWSPMKPKALRLKTAVLAIAVFLFAALPAWAGINTWTTNGPNADILALAISPADSTDQTIFAGTASGGVYKSTDGGASWTAVNSGLSNLDVQTLAISPAYSTDQTIFAGTAYYGGVYKSTDGGASWTAVNSGLSNLDVQTLAISPAYSTDQTIFAGTNSAGVFVSTNGGATWTAVNSGLPPFLCVSALAISPAYSSDQTIFAGNLASNGIFKSTDGGTSWTTVNPYEDLSLAISPAYSTDQTIFVGTVGSGILKSTDGGASWTAAGLSGNIRAIVISPTYSIDQTLFAGDGSGVYKSTNGGASWTAVNSGLTNTDVYALAISPTYNADQTIFAGTYGGGVYSYTFPTVDLPRTGQTSCYDSSGNVIACAGTGQDGAIQAGVAWPVPRFTDNGDQTITDNLTGLIWPKDGSTPTMGTCTGGAMTWQGALDYVACLNANNYLGHNDWRLPNRIELESLVDDGQPNQATWLSAQGFANTQSYYWSSTTRVDGPYLACNVHFDGNGTSGCGDYKSTSMWVRCVRGGQSVSLGNSIISLPQTGQTTCYDSSGNVIACTGTGQDGDIQAGVAWPNPRFTDNGDQTITDNLTGLIWQKDGSTPTMGTCTGGAMTWQGALDYVACLNANNYLGHNDWRLPNRIELESLVDDGQPNQATWLSAQGFANTQPYYWSSTTLAGNPYFAWMAYFDGYGYDSFDYKTQSYDVWLVRGGQSGALGNFVLTVSKTGTGSGTVTPDSGTITWSGNTGTATYASGTTVIFTAANDPGSTFTGWSGDCNSSGQVTMDSNKSCTATFTSDQYTVTPSAGTGGTISPDTPRTVNYNATTSFTITPNTGYSISSVTGCGGTLIRDTYTTGAIVADCTVLATFASNTTTYTVTPSAGSGGSISPSFPQTVSYNSTASFTVTPDTDYHITSVTGCGGSLAGNTYTTGPITSDCTVSATFSVNSNSAPINEFTVPTANSSPDMITAASDGNLWFTERSGNKIGRITTAGVITEFPIPTVGSLPTFIAAGPDGNLWFAESTANQIGRITPSGVITEFAISTAGSTPTGIAAGPDGNLWFDEKTANNIGRITPSGVITEFAIPTANSTPVFITAGPDGNLWFTEAIGNKIGRITTAGVVTEFPIPTASSHPLGIATGPDGNLWFAETYGNKIGRITTSGVITEFPVPTAGGNPLDIATGPDGNLWFGENGNTIGRITTSGVITEFTTTTTQSNPAITAGPDGNLWFTEYDNNKIGQLITSDFLSGWELVAWNGFGNSNNSNLGPGVALNGYFYIGTDNATSAEIYRTADGVNWEAVMKGGFGNPDNTYADSFTIFNGFLYVSILNNVTGVQIWRTKAVGAPPFSDWKQVNIDGFGNAANSRGLLTIVNGRLYVATRNVSTGIEIWRSSLLGGPPFTDWVQVNTDGFGDSNNSDTNSSLDFNGYLYVSTDNAVTGIQVWRTAEVGGPPYTDWERVNINGFGDSNNTGSSPPVIFNGRLYYLTRNDSTGAQLWRTGGEGGVPFADWQQVNIGGFNGSIVSGLHRASIPVVYNGLLYWTYDNALWKSSDGTTWTKEDLGPTPGLLFGDPNNYDPRMFEEFNGRLYIGTRNVTNGGQIWRTTTTAPTGKLFIWWNDSSTSFAVNFEATGSACPNGGCTYTWDFGDGATGSGQVLSHAYANGNPVVVTLTVSNGGSTSQTVTPIAAHMAPVCGATNPPTAGTVGSPITFTDSSTGTEASLYINWGDGGAMSVGAIDSTLSHSYANVGTYLVAQIVQDSMGYNCTKKYAVKIGKTGSPVGSGTLTITTDAEIPASYYIKQPNDFGDVMTKASGSFSTGSVTVPLASGDYSVYLYFGGGHSCAWTQGEAVIVTNGGDTQLNLTGCY